MGNTKSQLLEKIEELVSPVLAENRMELVDLEFQHEHGQWILRFYLDKDGGITLDDCAMMSDRIGQVLDTDDPIPQNYSLEISSPGLYRPLRKLSDFQKYTGERVDVSLFAPQDGRRHFKGTIVSVQADNVSVESEGKTFVLPFASIAKAKLDPEIDV